MSVGSIINQATGKIYDDLIPQGGGINLEKGQIITATATQEVAFPQVPPADGSILSYDSAEPTGLKYIAVPGALPLDYQELISANAGNNPVVVPAPAHNGYVLTADTDPANASGLAWKAVGGSGTLNANAPLIDEEVANVSTLSINFSASVGEIPYGNGTAKTGALTVAPNPASSNQFLGTVAGVPTWKNMGNSSIGAIAPVIEIAGAGDESLIGIGFSASVGEIPYGNGTLNHGALTNVPTAGQILGMAGTPAVPTWINAGGSGTITATAPLKEFAGGGGASNIAIDFTAKGDLTVGAGVQVGGNPVAGLILPVGANGAVLTADTDPANQYGMSWVVPTPITGGQIQRITTPGTTTIPVPTTQNQQLQLIDIASSTNSFTYETGSLCPNTNFVPASNGVYPGFTNLIGGQFTFVIFGNDTTANVGQVWGYIPNILVPANGIWYKWIETGVGQNISCGCNLTQFNQDFGGWNNATGSDMVFGGNIQSITFYGTSGTTTLSGLLNFFYWELSPEQVVNPNFTTFSINPFPKGGLMLSGVPVGVANEIKFIATATGGAGSIPVNTPSGIIEYNGFAMITKSLPVVSAIVPLNGGVPTGATPNGFFGFNQPDAGGVFINYCNWTFNGNLAICGCWNSCVIAGTTVPGIQSWITLEYDPTPNSIQGFQAPAQPTNPGVQYTVQQVQNLYDPSQGVSVMGDFQLGGVFRIATMSIAGTFSPVDDESPGSSYTNGLMIDGGSYVGCLDFAQQILGLDNGYSATFGVPQGLRWFIPKINQGFPLSYIGIVGKQIYQGYFKIVANQSRVSFAPAKVRYALPSGTTGLAETAVLNSIYSSMTLIADLTTPATPLWDLVAQTGSITYS